MTRKCPLIREPTYYDELREPDAEARPGTV
jgi:hypothetical protein